MVIIRLNENSQGDSRASISACHFHSLQKWQAFFLLSFWIPSRACRVVGRGWKESRGRLELKGDFCTEQSALSPGTAPERLQNYPHLKWSSVGLRASCFQGFSACTASTALLCPHPQLLPITRDQKESAAPSKHPQSRLLPPYSRARSPDFKEKGKGAKGEKIILRPIADGWSDSDPANN